MGGCASKPKDLNAENPDLVPAERPTTSEPSVNPVAPEPKAEPETAPTTEGPGEAKEEVEEENKKEKEEVKGEELVVESNKAEVEDEVKVKGGEEDLISLKESETKNDIIVEEPTSTTTTTDIVASVTENKVDEEVKPEFKATEDKKPEEQN